MARIEKTVFISYRRKDISWALAVYQYLTSQKYDVFFDYTSLSSGDFEQVIVSNIKARAHFVLILTPTALDRCSAPEDWLRREIETAIDEKRNIIPLFFDGFSFGSSSVVEQLTGKMGAVRRYNGLEVPPGYFMEAMERLRNRYLNVPLDAVIQPVPTEVRKVVKEEQVAANKALLQKREDIQELVKPAEEKGVARTEPEGKISFKPVLRGLSIAVSLIALFFIGRFIIQNLPASQAPTSIIPLLTEMPATSLSRTPITPEFGIGSTQISPTETVTPAPTPGVGSTMIGEDGATLVYVPEGEFLMGSKDTDSISYDDNDERPQHSVTLDAFWIDQNEVTNKQYAACVSSANQCKPPSHTNSYTRPDYYGNSEFDYYPVIYVSWNDAKTYCEWAGRRLPTEAEWEKAARGTDARIYPWGDDMPNKNLLNYNLSVGDTTKIGTYLSGKSIYGAYDMAGNVWEWVNDWYNKTYYQSSPSLNPSGPDSDDVRVLRGGSWNYDASKVRSADRYRRSPTDPYNDIGFRCARDTFP